MATLVGASTSFISTAAVFIVCVLAGFQYKTSGRYVLTLVIANLLYSATWIPLAVGHLQQFAEYEKWSIDQTESLCFLRVVHC